MFGKPWGLQKARQISTLETFNKQVNGPLVNIIIFLFIKLEKRRCTWSYEVAFRSFLPIQVISLGSSALRSMIQPLFTCLSFLGITFRNHLWALGGISHISKTISGKILQKFNDSIIGNTESLPSERMCSLSWLSFDESNWKILSPDFQQVNLMLGNRGLRISVL